MKTELSIRLAAHSELERVSAAYREWGSTATVIPADVVYLAELDGELIGLVRRRVEHGLTMLRGMHVALAHQRKGVGSQLLSRFVANLDADCYCVPHVHLTAFYGQEGFAPLSESTAPLFLQERLAEYRARGMNVLLMHHRAGE